MAAEPIPLQANDHEVDISPSSVSGVVQITNGGEVKFKVLSYPIDPNTGEPYNTCIVTITEANITWATDAILTGNTIKVGNGGGEGRKSFS